MKLLEVSNIDKTEIARFTEFLTGKNYDNIYKKILNPFNVNERVFKEDLRFVRNYFEKLKLNSIVKMINAELNSEV